MIFEPPTEPLSSPAVGQTAGDRRFFLDNPARMWIVGQGYVELFAVVDSVSHHVMRVNPGEAIFGVHERAGSRVRLLACVPSDSVVRCVPVEQNTSRALIERWIAGLGTAVGMPGEPKERCLPEFHAAALELLDRRICAREEETRKRLRAKAISSATAMRSAFLELAAPVSGTRAQVPLGAVDEVSSNLSQAFEYVAKALGGFSSRSEHTPAISTLSREEAVATLARSWNLAAREVTLASSWWRHDAGPLLGFRHGRPVALICNRGSGYELWDPADGQRARVDSRVAASLEPGAFSFYRVLPDGPTTPLRLLWFGVRACHKDVQRIALTGLAIGFVGLATPLITARLIGFVIAEADRAEAILLAALLAVCSAATALFSYARAIALQRLVLLCYKIRKKAEVVVT